MFSSPKWLLFAVLVFGSIHMFSFSMGFASTEFNLGALSYGGGFAGALSSILTYEYEYLTTEWAFLRFILAAFQAIFIFFAAKEVADWIRGR